jgi:hypothetical protein
MRLPWRLLLRITVALRRMLRMVSTGTGILRMWPRVSSLQARCIGRVFAFRLSAAVLNAGMQPRRTAGENELPQDQQRRQNLKAGLRHALRATRKRELSARPVAGIVPDRADKSIVYRDLNRKLPPLSGLRVRGRYCPKPSFPNHRREPLPRPA